MTASETSNVTGDYGAVPAARRRVVAAAIVGVIVALVALVGFLAYQRATLSTIEANRTAVIDVASDQALAMLSYTPVTVDDTLRAAADGLTPSFSAEYLELLDTVVVPDAQNAGTATRVSVAGAAVTEVDRSSASVLLFLNQSTTTTAAPEPTVSGSRVIVRLEKMDDRWLVDDLSPT